MRGNCTCEDPDDAEMCVVHRTRWSEYDHLPALGIYRTRECYRDGDMIHTNQKAYPCKCVSCTTRSVPVAAPPDAGKEKQ